MWPHRWLECPDFRAPRSMSDAVGAVEETFARAASERVEVACDGGIGRTGMALSALVIVAGVPAREAVGWVREHYHTRAIETPWQRRWVLKFARARRP
jgi:protein-tyrosine phosphatase